METYFNFPKAEEGSSEKLIYDLRILMRDMEDFARDAGRKLTHRSRKELGQALERIKGACRSIENETATWMRSTDRTIRHHPYQAVGAALALGIVVGLIARR
jgi:ElaB/YqjD/DUF883 family membrane-anchored ribosome-binding protein